MIRVILTISAAFATLLVLVTFQGCFELQRAIGCPNTGLFGCRDEPSEIEPTATELKPAQGRYLEAQEFPWSRPLDECMATGRNRTECFESLPPEILTQFEQWEQEKAAMRRKRRIYRSGVRQGIKRSIVATVPAPGDGILFTGTRPEDSRPPAG